MVKNHAQICYKPVRSCDENQLCYFQEVIQPTTWYLIELLSMKYKSTI